MNIIGCLDGADEGLYLLNNVNVSALTDDQMSMVRAEKIGFIFQNFHLLTKKTALENVMLPLNIQNKPKKSTMNRAKNILELVGLKGRMQHRPMELSGGQRQRVAIARALIAQPLVILADEPTGNLDSQTTLEIMDVLEHLHQQGSTIIIVTHEMDIAKRAERVIQLVDGKIFSDVKQHCNSKIIVN